MDDSLDPISLLESKHGPAHIWAAEHIGKFISPEERKIDGQRLRHQRIDRNFEHPAPSRHRTFTDSHEQSPPGSKQSCDPRQGMSSLVLLEMHPHGSHQDEAEPLTPGMNLRQIR